MSTNEFNNLDFYHRQERILDEAARLFSKKGYDAVTTMELAQKAGCSEAMLLTVFASKEEIFQMLFEEWHSQIMFPAKIEILSSSALITLKKFYFEQMSRSFNRTKRMRPHLEGAIFNRYTDDNKKKVYQALNEGPDFVKTALVPVFEFGQKNGELKEGNALAFATIFWTLIWGQKDQMRQNNSSDYIPFEEIAKIFIK